MIRGARWIAALLAIVACAGTIGCDAVSSLDATEVPGAAATAARSARTAIPTPVDAASPVSALASPSPPPLAVASPSTTLSSAAPDPNGTQTQAALQRALASPDLPGIENLLLNQVSLSTPDGGEVLDRPGAASWLRSHAGPGIQLTTFARSQQTVIIQAVTEGWPQQPPLTAGKVTMDFHRYDAEGHPDEESGNWMVDVIAAE